MFFLRYLCGASPRCGFLAPIVESIPIGDFELVKISIGVFNPECVCAAYSIHEVAMVSAYGAKAC